MNDGNLHFEAPSMPEDRALDMAIYHLQMAAYLFQGLPEDAARKLIEKMDEVGVGDPVKCASEGFLAEIGNWYLELGADYGD